MSRHVLYYPELPSYLSVSYIIEDRHPSDMLQGEGGSVYVEVVSTIHKNKLIVLPMSFSEAYMNKCYNRFRLEVLDYIIRSYGLKKEPMRYS